MLMTHKLVQIPTRRAIRVVMIHLIAHAEETQNVIKTLKVYVRVHPYV